MSTEQQLPIVGHPGELPSPAPCLVPIGADTYLIHDLERPDRLDRLAPTVLWPEDYE